jgi:hypothetical protein
MSRNSCKHHCDQEEQCACESHGRWTTKEKNGFLITLIIVPIVFAIVAPFYYSYSMYQAEYPPWVMRTMTSVFTAWFISIILAAVSLAALVRRRNDCLCSVPEIKCWQRVVAALFVYIFATMFWIYALALPSALVAGLLNIIAISVAVFLVGRRLSTVSEWAPILFGVSVAGNIVLAFYTLAIII